jgi:hypothetical protein
MHRACVEQNEPASLVSASNHPVRDRPEVYCSQHTAQPTAVCRERETTEQILFQFFVELSKNLESSGLILTRKRTRLPGMLILYAAEVAESRLLRLESARLWDVYTHFQHGEVGAFRKAARDVLIDLDHQALYIRASWRNEP